MNTTDTTMCAKIEIIGSGKNIDMILQQDLEDYIRIQKIINVKNEEIAILTKGLNEEIGVLNESLMKAKADLFSKLKKNFTIEPGTLDAFIASEIKKGKLSVKWKEEYCEFLAKNHGVTEKEIDKQMRTKYPVKDTTTETLVVEIKKV